MSIVVKSKAELTEILKDAGDKLVVIDFHAVWCGPCKNIAPFLEKLALKHKDELVVLKVDVDEAEAIAHEYKIDMMPTFVFKRRSEHLDTLTGSSEEKLEGLILKHLAKK